MWGHSQGKALSWSQVMLCLCWKQRMGLRMLPMAELAQGARTSVPCPRNHQRSKKGGPVLGPLPAPGQSVPSIPAAWRHPIMGTPIAKGSKPLRVGLGTDLCWGRAGGHRKGHCALPARAGTCAECCCPFPLKKGKRWSFTPSSPSAPGRLGGNLLVVSAGLCSAPSSPLPPSTGLTTELLWAHPGTAQGLGGHSHCLGISLQQRWGDVFCKLGGGTRPAGAKRVLSPVLGCSHAYKPHSSKLPWISIPGALQSLCLLKSSETRSLGPGSVGGKSPVLQADRSRDSPHLPAHWGSCLRGCEIKAGGRML